MRAVVWNGNNSFAVEEVKRPPAKDEQVLVEVKAASICTTDFHYGNFNCIPPIIPGHEVSGIIVEVGKGIKPLRVGDRVTLDPVQRCGECYCCTSGIEHLCLNTRHLGNTEIPGGWAEFVAIDAANAYRIPEGMDFETAALTEPAAVCLESFYRAGFQKGWSVLIMGDGTFGFIHAMSAKILGAEKIIVAGHYDERLGRIKKATGAITCNTHNEDLTELLREHICAVGVDIAIEATGAGPVVNIALNALRPRGTLILFSYVWQPEVMDLGLAHMKELNVLGACRSLGCFERCIELVQNKQLDLASLIDIKVPLEEVTAAMEKLTTDKKNTFKAVLLP
jgi:2-desacetyl-2-hydroxyethyl bacteriochlorophyllide A dehydrogenase